MPNMPHIDKIAVVALLVLGSFLAGMQQFAHQIRSDIAIYHALTQPLGAHRTGIVVVTGSRGRIEAGFQLLLNTNAEQMLISGTGNGVAKSDILAIAASDGVVNLARLREQLDCCVDLGGAARNTRGNADETLQWINTRNLDRIILVTSDFHMPRTLREFRRSMADLQVIPHPVPTKGLGLAADGGTEWWRSSSRLITISWEYTKYLASTVG